ncbi:hypothetical protein D3C80_2047810 [compost metagenome]
MNSIEKARFSPSVQALIPDRRMTASAARPVIPCPIISSSNRFVPMAVSRTVAAVRFNCFASSSAPSRFVVRSRISRDRTFAAGIAL